MDWCRLDSLGAYIAGCNLALQTRGSQYGRILLLAYTIIISFSLYERLVIGFGRVSDLATYPKGVCVTFGISGVLGGTIQVCICVPKIPWKLISCQSFFANRLRKLSGAIIVPVICWILCLSRVGAVLAISVVTCRVNSIQEYVDHWAWLGHLALSAFAAADLMISASLSYCLWTRRKDIFKQWVA
jgi:hypothetical protein